MRKLNKQTNPQYKVVAVKHNQIAFRMNIIFFIIFILFIVLIARIGYMQIIKGPDYVNELRRTEEINVLTSVPRGNIYDRYGRVLVDNEPEKAITYTKMQTTKQSEMIQIAKELAILIDVPSDNVTKRDMQDFWIYLNPEQAKKKVSQEEMQVYRNENPKLKKKDYNAEYDRRVRERITDEELATLSEYDLKVLAIYNKMRTGYSLSPQIIKGENVTDAEFAKVSERLDELTGMNTITDWKRVRYTTLGILGRTTVPTKGIPKNKVNYYLAREYARNDRVGESYFEAQYEELLQGEKVVQKNVTDRQGQVVQTVTTFAGEPGKDLVTTLDSRLQAEADRIMEAKLLDLKAKGHSHLLDRAFFVMLDPNTGELLSVVGKKLERDVDTGKQYMIDYSYGTFTTAYEAGSVVKGATLLMGYEHDVIQPGTVMLDAPMQIGNLTLNSLFNKTGSVMLTDQKALEVSSNVYMFKVAMALGGRKYAYGMKFSLAPNTLQIMRNGYAQFGLGVPTGIDLPGEMIGVQTAPDRDAKLLNLAIGQFDTYTTMQLAQYIATIANGGQRIQPRILKEIRKHSKDGETMGQLQNEIAPVLLNRIGNTDEEINHVKEGLRLAYYGRQGSARKQFQDFAPTAAGKTGTAQVSYTGPLRQYSGSATINIVHVGFAPFDKPEVAYAVLFPWATTNFDSPLPHANEAAREILDVYFNLKAEYKNTGFIDQTIEPKILPPISGETLSEDEQSN